MTKLPSVAAPPSHSTVAEPQPPQWRDDATAVAVGSTHGFIIASFIPGPDCLPFLVDPTINPKQLSVSHHKRLVRLRQLVTRHRQPRRRFAAVGARTIQKEWRQRYREPAPSVSAMQRVLKRHRLTIPTPRQRPHAYRPHPDAPSPNAVQATDIITRWITGGEVVQTFHTVDISSNAVSSTSHAAKTTTVACEHVLHTWQQLGIPDVAPCDNASAFNGGNHPWVLGRVARLCLSMGIAVVFIPLREADDHSPVETFNHLWAQRFWGRHHFTHRRDVSRVQRTFLAWYRSQYIAPRQPDTPERMRLGARLHRLAPCDAINLPKRLPICAGRVQAVRRVSPEGRIRFLKHTLRVGKRYRGRYVWLTLETAHQRLSMWYQVRAGASWKRLKIVEAPMRESVAPIPKRCARLHATRQPRPRDTPVIANSSKPATIAAQTRS